MVYLSDLETADIISKVSWIMIQYGLDWDEACSAYMGEELK